MVSSGDQLTAESPELVGNALAVPYVCTAAELAPITTGARDEITHIEAVPASCVTAFFAARSVMAF